VNDGPVEGSRGVSLVFPEFSNRLPKLIGAALGFGFVAVALGVTYYFTPKFWEVGYAPEQPVSYSHQIHVGKLGMDCRYCHTHVEEAKHANIPDTATCMNCHAGAAGVGGLVNASLWAAHEINPNLVRVREAYASGAPIRWKRTHKLPDYAHFNHAVHVNAGVSCFSCHGNIHEQEVVRQVQSLSMGWCLDCHRRPERHLVEATDVGGVGNHRITDLAHWASVLANTKDQRQRGLDLADRKQIEPPQDCGACHY
jgi:hypothetical protein